MRTVPEHVPASQRCGHCGMPDALHTREQRATCEKRMLADLSRSWPRTVKTRAELDARIVKNLKGVAEAFVQATHRVELSAEERTCIETAMKLLAAHNTRRGT